MLHMLPRVLEEPVSTGSILQCPEAVKRSYFAVNTSRMARAEVTRVSSHSHHGGANVPDSGALVELWGIYDASRQAARPCYLIQGRRRSFYWSQRGKMTQDTWTYMRNTRSLEGELPWRSALSNWEFTTLLKGSSAVPQRYPSTSPATSPTTRTPPDLLKFLLIITGQTQRLVQDRHEADQVSIHLHMLWPFQSDLGNFNILIPANDDADVIFRSWSEISW